MGTILEYKACFNYFIMRFIIENKKVLKHKLYINVILTQLNLDFVALKEIGNYITRYNGKITDIVL